MINALEGESVSVNVTDVIVAMHRPTRQCTLGTHAVAVGKSAPNSVSSVERQGEEVMFKVIRASSP